MNSPLLGIDIGLQRTGVALSESGLIARPLKVIEADQPHMSKVLHALIDCVREYEIKTVVIGMPYTEEGSPTNQALKVEHIISAFKNLLSEENLPVEIEEVNEFYSTQEAKALFPDSELDAAAAAIILQEYINQHSE